MNLALFFGHSFKFKLALKNYLLFLQESFRPSSSNVSVDIFMADGSKETVRCNVEHPTEIILKVLFFICLRKISETYPSYFVSEKQEIHF